MPIKISSMQDVVSDAGKLAKKMSPGIAKAVSKEIRRARIEEGRATALPMALISIFSNTVAAIVAEMSYQNKVKIDNDITKVFVDYMADCMRDDFKRFSEIADAMRDKRKTTEN